jgi:hypothetical protein
MMRCDAMVGFDFLIFNFLNLIGSIEIFSTGMIDRILVVNVQRTPYCAVYPEFFP